LITSMTGFGRGYYKDHGIGVSVEIKSVNHRYIDIFFRLPRELHAWEDSIREIIKEYIHRGRVEVTLKIEDVPGEAYDLSVNLSLVQAYRDAMEEINSYLSLQDSISLDHFLKISDIFTVVNLLGEKAEMQEVIEKSVKEALNNLLTQRRKEGENLKKDLLEKCSRMQEHLKEIKKISPEIAEQHRIRLQKKLKDLLGDGWDENRIIAECALLAERSDIEEELIRAESHLQSFMEALETGEAVGRKLDFILQEMLREINTMGSKANHYGIASQVVEAKADLERTREQVQNIE